MKRKPRTKGYNLCPSCYDYGCYGDGPSNPFFARKIRERKKDKVCVSCGHNPCECKSRIYWNNI